MGLTDFQKLLFLYTKEVEEIPTKVTKVLRKALSNINVKSLGSENSVKRINGTSDEVFKINGFEVHVKLEDLGEKQPECKFNHKTRTLIINALHPMYIKARELDCLDYHSLRAVIMALALNMAKRLPDFAQAYEKLAHQCVHEAAEKVAAIAGRGHKK